MKKSIGFRFEKFLVLICAVACAICFAFALQLQAHADEESSGSSDSSCETAPAIEEILRVGLTPSLRMTEGDRLSTSHGTTDGQSDAQLSAKRVGQRAMYRLYNPYSGEHFYTCDEKERDNVVKAGWKNESIGWVAPKTSSTPVYRVYNKYAGDHHYTPSKSERDVLIKAGWNDEGIGWYSADSGSLFRAPVYRQYNPNAWVGTHNYTLSTKERDTLVKAGWKDEGVGYYGLDQSLMSAVDFDKDIKVTTTSKVYNGKAQTQTITSSNLKLNEDYVVEYSNNVNVGTATITITGTNGFYGERKYTFNITQKPVTVKWDATEFAYDGKAHVPTATAVGLCGKDAANITVVASGDHTKTGTYVASATAISNKNYKLSGTLKTTFRIGTPIDFDSKNKPTVDTKDEIYKGSEITKSVSVEGLTQGTDYTVIYKNNKDVGTATLTIKGIGEYFGERPYTFNITKKALTVSWSKTELTYNGQAQTPTPTFDGVCGSDKVVPKITGAKKDVGDDYSADVTIAEKNYELTGTTATTFKISKAQLSVKWSNTELTYRASPLHPKAEFQGVCKGDTVIPTISGEETNANETGETYTATVAIDLNSQKNYEISNNVSTNFTIAKAPLTVTWSNTTLTYNAGKQKPTATIAGKQGSDTITTTVSGEETNANETGKSYTATVSIDATSAKNYEISNNVSTNFTIAKAPLTVTWTNKSLTYNAGKQKPTATIAGKQGSDTITTTVSGEETNANETGKSYTATVSIDATSAKNYEISNNVSTNFTIAKAPLTVTWTNTSLTYNAGKQKPTATISGKQGSDTIETTISGEETNANETGKKYTASLSIDATSQKNYEISNPTTQFTIGKASLTLTWTNTSFEYDTTEHIPSAAISSGKQGSDSITLSVSGKQINANADGETHTATASIDATSQKNYEIGNATTTFTISPLDISASGVITLGTSLTYDGTTQTQSVESVKVGTISLGSGDYDLSGNTGKDAMTYTTLTVTGKGNFKGTKSTSFTIARLSIKDAAIVLDNAELTYTGSSLTKNVTSVKVGELSLTATTDYTLSGDSATTAGDHKMTFTGIGNFTGEASAIYSILKATPTYVAPSGFVGYYGEILSEVPFTQPSNGKFSWESSDTVLTTLGKSTEFTIAFTPNDTDNYEEVSGIKTDITVKREVINKSKLQTALKGLANKPTTLKFAKGSDSDVKSATSMCADGVQEDGMGKIGVFQSGDNTTVYIAAMEGRSSTLFAPADCSYLLSSDSTSGIGFSTLTSISCSNLDTSDVTNMKSMFEGCSKASTCDVSNFDTSKVTDMSSMFKGCSAATSLSTSNFVTTEVTNMAYMFDSCSTLMSLTVTSFNTSKVTDMSHMFDGCTSLISLNVSKFDTTNVTNMASMFNACKGLSGLNVKKFKTSKVTDMSCMFQSCSDVAYLEVENFDTSSVTTMNSMFASCSGLVELDVSKFATSNVKDMAGMFDFCKQVSSIDVTNFNTSSVTDMKQMFFGCLALTSLNVTNFNTSKVKDMSSMFGYCQKLTSLDVTKFDTSKVKSMSGMFYKCSGLSKLNLASFKTSNVTNMVEMFSGCTSLVTIYVSANFVTTAVTEGSDMFEDCSKLTGSAGSVCNVAAKQVDVGYAHVDGGYGNEGYFTLGTVDSV